MKQFIFRNYENEQGFIVLAQYLTMQTIEKMFMARKLRIFFQNRTLQIQELKCDTLYYVQILVQGNNNYKIPENIFIFSEQNLEEQIYDYLNYLQDSIKVLQQDSNKYEETKLICQPIESYKQYQSDLLQKQNQLYQFLAYLREIDQKLNDFIEQIEVLLQEITD